MFVNFNHSQAFRDTVLDQWRDGLISEKLEKSMMATTADKHQAGFFMIQLNEGENKTDEKHCQNRLYQVEKL